MEPAAAQHRVDVEAGTPRRAAISTGPSRWCQRRCTIRRTSGRGVRRGQRCGRELRSTMPAGPACSSGPPSAWRRVGDLKHRRARRDDGGGASLVVGHQAGGQSCDGDDLERGRRLAVAGLEQDRAPRSQPVGSGRDHPPRDVETVGAAVERHPRLVQPGLRRHERDRCAGHVRHVGQQHVHPAPECVRQRLEEVALVHVTADAGDVAPRARDGGRVDVGGVQVDAGHRGRDGDAQRSGPAAEVDDDGARPGERDRLLDQRLGPATRDEHTRGDRDPQPVELRPPEHVLERFTGHPPRHQSVESDRRPGLRQEQPCLVLGEHAPRGAQSPDDGFLERLGHGAGTLPGGGTRRVRRPRVGP